MPGNDLSLPGLNVSYAGLFRGYVKTITTASNDANILFVVFFTAFTPVLFFHIRQRCITIPVSKITGKD